MERRDRKRAGGRGRLQMMRDTVEEKEGLGQQWEGKGGAPLGAKRAWGLEAPASSSSPSPTPNLRVGQA